MRTDGDVTYYVVQHLVQHPDSPSRGRWMDSALETFLFKNLTYEQRRGRVGEFFRGLLAPQSASSALWQRYGIHGFEHPHDADRMLAAVQLVNEHERFRVVRRRMMREQVVVHSAAA